MRSKTNVNARHAPREAGFHLFPAAWISLPWLSLVLPLAWILYAAAPGTGWAQPASDVDQVKAAFLFHFAQLVDWPPDAFDGNRAPLVLCTLEDDAFYEELENTIQGRQIASRTVRIRYVHLSQAARGCNILFISKSESKSLQLAALRNLPVLTVGESDDFLSSGGMIRFRFEQDRVRFDINLGAADSSHLKISSRLLLLASSVTPGDRTKGGN